jgi:hypothetical protein
MQKIEIDKNNFILFKPTPWDARVFGFNTGEIKGISYKNPQSLKELLQKLDEYNQEEKIRLIYIRIDAEEKILRKYLQDSGFYYAETTLIVEKKDLQTSELPIQSKGDFLLGVPSGDDFDQIKEIAKNDFFYGRFHEDPHLDFTKAQLRFFNWIDDMIKQGREIMVYKKDKEIIGFHIQSVTENKSDLILTGTKREKSMISYYFWATILESLKERGVKEAKATISAANKPIVNLYSFFNFNFERTLLGFHKLYKN